MYDLEELATFADVMESGSLTVSASQLVDSTGHHTQPFPCDGTLAHGCAGATAAVLLHSAPQWLSSTWHPPRHRSKPLHEETLFGGQTGVAVDQ